MVLFFFICWIFTRVPSCLNAHNLIDLLSGSIFGQWTLSETVASLDFFWLCWGLLPYSAVPAGAGAASLRGLLSLLSVGSRAPQATAKKSGKRAQ